MTERSDQDINRHNSGLGNSELAQLIKHLFLSVVTNRVVVKTVLFAAKAAAVIISIVSFFAFFLYLVPFVQDPGKQTCKPPENIIRLSENTREYKRHISSLKSEVRSLSVKFRALTPGHPYLVINTTENKFYLYRNRNLIREGFCSSGSYTRLVSPEGSREWIFRTPKGKFRIQQKVVKPMWIKPDWAFIEEGLPVPPPNHESRYERGVLGDYAMSLGDGYLIHGTLYQRFIGLPVTHGCVRLGDEDLEEVFNTLNVGSRVYIF